MKPEEFSNLTTDILSNLQDQAKVSQVLTQMNDIYRSNFTLQESLQNQQQQHEKEIQALKETNMNLFLKIKTPVEENKTPDLVTDKKEELTFENLVNEMGK